MPISNITTGEPQAFGAPAVQPQPARVSPLVEQKSGDGITRVRDANGRSIGVKPLKAIDMFRLTKAMGDDASNAALFRQAMVAVAAVEIDGELVARPSSMMTIEALISRLDFAGFVAVSTALSSASTDINVDAVDRIGGADGGLLKLQEALGLTAKAGDDAGRTITESFGGVDRAVRTTAEGVNALKTSFLEAAEAAKAIQVASSNIGGGGGSHGGNSGPHGGGVFHALSSGVGGNIKGLVGGAAGAAFGPEGMAAGYLGYEVFEKGADLEQARVLMQNKGVTPDKIDEAQRMAFSMSPKIGESAAAIMKMMADIGAPLNQGTTGNSAINAAEKHIGTVGDALTVFRSLDGKNGTDLEKQVFQLVKSGELRNAVASDSEFDSAMSAMVKGSIANPMVGPEQWFQFISKARSAGMRADNDWIYKVGPELITEFNAPGAGTAWSSLYQGIVSGKLTKGSMAEMDAIHAFDDNPDKVTRDKHGNVTHLKPGAMGSIGDAFAHNPGEGMQMLIDRIDAKLTADNKGVSLSDEARKKGEEDWLTKVFGNRNAAQFSLTLAEQKARLGRGAQAADNAADLTTAAANVRNGDPNFGVAQFQAALSNLAATMGNLAMPAIVTSMQQLAAAAEGATAALKYIGDLNDKSKQFLKPLDALANPLKSGSVYEGDMGASISDALHPDAAVIHRPVSHSMAGPGGWSNMGVGRAEQHDSREYQRDLGGPGGGQVWRCDGGTRRTRRRDRRTD